MRLAAALRPNPLRELEPDPLAQFGGRGPTSKRKGEGRGMERAGDGKGEGRKVGGKEKGRGNGRGEKIRVMGLPLLYLTSGYGPGGEHTWEASQKSPLFCSSGTTAV